MASHGENFVESSPATMPANSDTKVQVDPGYPVILSHIQAIIDQTTTKWFRTRHVPEPAEVALSCQQT